MATAKKKSSTSDSMKDWENQGNGFFVAPKKKPSPPTTSSSSGPKRVVKVTTGSELDSVIKKKYSAPKRADLQAGKKSFISSFQDVVSEGEIKMPNGKILSGTSAQAQAAARRVATEQWEKARNYYSSAKIPTNKRGPAPKK